MFCFIGKAQQYTYCEIVGTNNTLIGKNKISIELDFGNEQGTFINNQLVDENGKAIKFNSMVDAMNWMGESGWEFCQAYVVTLSNVNVYHWLLRLDLENLSEEEQIAIFGQFKTKTTVKKQMRAEKKALNAEETENDNL